jgi:hypothetical protein
MTSLRIQRWTGLLLGLALLCCGPRARAENDLLKNARNTFEYGDYDHACNLAENLLASHQLVEERDLVEAYKIAGLANFFLNRLDTARRHLVSLLSVDPDYAMDPFLVPPAAVAFFDGVKRDNEALLEPLRQRRKAMAEQERLAEEARRKLLEENLMRQMEPNRPVLVERVEVHTLLPNFVPFGAGQFAEGRTAMGALFAGTQLAGLATSVACFAKIESLRNPFGRYAAADVGTVENLATAKWAGLGLFGASVVLGIADSLVNYQPTTRRIEALAQPPSHPSPAPAAPGSPSLPHTLPVDAPAPHTQILRPVLTPWATSSSFGLGLGLRF